MTASLPMYDLAGLEDATEAWFQGLMRHLAAHGVTGVPTTRTTAINDRVAHWSDPALVLSQTCGHPFATHLSNRVRVVAAPVYRIDGADGQPRYRGVLIVNANSVITTPGDLRGKIAAVNGTDSYSGFAALHRVLRAACGDGAILGGYRITGGHPASVEAVASGAADCATIDAVTLALLGRTRPDLAAQVRVLDPGPWAPALPYITAGSRTDDEVIRIQRALADAIADTALADTRHTLLIDGLVARSNDDYAAFEGWARAAAENPVAERAISG